MLEKQLNLHASVYQTELPKCSGFNQPCVKPEEAWCVLSPMAEGTAREASLACWLHTEQWLSSYWAIMKPGYGESTAPHSPEPEPTCRSAELLSGIWWKQAHRSSTPPIIYLINYCGLTSKCSHSCLLLITVSRC